MTQQLTLSQGLHIRQEQKLTPQQVQTLNLLQMPSLDLEQKLTEELRLNPVRLITIIGK